MKYTYIYIIIFLIFPLIGHTQTSEEQEELIDTAEELFYSASYDKAMPLYSQLLSIYPSEAIYSFYYGACLVENNKEIDKAIKYLSYASRKLTDHALVYFYLGKAYHLSYQFDKAIKQYQTFQAMSSKGVQKDKQLERELKFCNNGLELVKYVSNLIVLDNKKINVNNFQYSYKLDEMGGKLVVKPDIFKTKVDLKRNKKELIYISDSGLVFFSSLGNNKNNDRDIYWTKKDLEGEFLPSKIIDGPINSEFDEDYPFLKSDGKTLYFCSKGHNTMGGFDIFKSVYDSTNLSWSEPENLDFPTNTPYDDILYVIDKDDKIAYFSSNRESQEGKLNVYKILVDKNPTERTTNSLDEIKQIAKLEITPLADMPEQKEKSNATATTEVADYKSVAPQNNFSFDEIYKSHLSTPGDYNKLLNSDLKYLNQKLEESKTKRQIAANIAHSKSGKIRELQSQIEIRENNLSPEEQSINIELQALRSKLIKTNFQANIAAEASIKLNKEINSREKEIKITQMLLNDSANNNSSELIQNINANRKFLEQNSKGYLSIINWTHEKERERDALIEESKAKEKLANKKDLAFKQSLVNYESVNKAYKNAKEPNEITNAKTNLNNAKDDLRTYQDEVIEAQNDLAIQKSKINRIDEEIIFLNSFKTEFSDDNLKSIAQNNQLNYESIEENAQQSNQTIALWQKNIAEQNNQAKYSKQTEDIFDSNTELLTDNNLNSDTEIDKSIIAETEANKNDLIDKPEDDKNKTEANVNKEEQPLAQNNSKAITNNTNTGSVIPIPPITNNNSSDSINNNSTATNTSNKPNNKTIAETNLLKVNSFEALKKFHSAKYNAQVSDSLFLLANTKEKELARVSQEDSKQIIKDEVKELRTIANIKQKQSYKEYAEAENLERDYLINNKPDSTFNALIEQKFFTFNSETTDSPELIEYKKSAFIEQYYKKVDAQIGQKKQAIKDALDSDNISEESKIKLQKELDHLNLATENLRPIITNARKRQLEAKKILVKNNETFPVSEQEITASATDIQLNQELVLSKQNSKSLKLANKDLAKAETLKKDWIAYSKEIKVLEDSLYRVTDLEQRNELSLELEDIKEDAWIEYRSFVELKQSANLNKAKVYDQLLAQNRRYTYNEDSKKAYLFEKEADLLMSKANALRNSNNTKGQFDFSSSDVIDQSFAYEEIALNRKKSALNIYNKLPKDAEYSANIDIDENDKSSVTSKVKKPDSKLENLGLTELLPDEEERIDEYQDLYNKSEAKKIKANSYWNNVMDTEAKIGASYKKKDQQKLEAKKAEQEVKSKNTYHEAFQIEYTANLEKHQLYQDKIKKAISNSDNKKKASIASQYLLDSKFYYEEAQKIKIDSTENWYNLKNQHAKKNALEQKALQADVLAYQSLISDKDDIFLGEGSLVIVDPLAINQKAVDISLVEKVQEKRILDKIELENFEIKILSKNNKLKTKLNKLENNYQNNTVVIQELNDTLPLITDPKQWEKTDKELTNLENETFALLFEMSSLSEPINADKFYVYKNHIRDVRLNNKSDSAKQARELEKVARREMNKARSLRNRAFDAVTVEKAFELQNEAGKLEKSAIEDMEKAYTIYLGLKPLDQEVEEYIYANSDTNKVNELGLAVIESDGQVEAYETPDFEENTNVTDSINEIENITKNNGETIDNNTDLLASESKSNINPIVVPVVVNQNTNNDSIPDNKELGTQATESELNNTNLIEEPIDNTINQEAQALTEQNNITTNNSSVDNSISSPVVVPISSSTTADAINKEDKDIEAESTENITDKNNSAPISLLSIKNTSVYNKTNPIPMDKPLPEGIVYKIQIGAFTKAIPQNSFRGLTPITGETRQNSRYIRYFVGQFNTYDAANTALPYIKQTGYKDAFVVAYLNGKRIAVYIAKKESKKDNNYSTIAKAETESVLRIISQNPNTAANLTTNTSNPSVNINQIEETIYTIQIGAYKTHVSHARLKNLTPLYNDQTKTGLIRYYVGKYFSLDEANKRKTEIRQKGIKDAFVTAFKNGKKISLSQAKKNLISQSTSNNSTTTKPIVEKENTTVKETKTSYNADKLTYRVQIGAFAETVPVNVVSSFVQLSMLDQLEHFMNSSGKTVYTIGQFKSLKQASKLKQELINKGISDAFIIAFDGKIKVSIDEAKKVLQP